MMLAEDSLSMLKDFMSWQSAKTKQVMKHTTSQGERSRTVTRLTTVISTVKVGPDENLINLNIIQDSPDLFALIF